MGRIKIELPDQTPAFEAEIPIRITDLNYGNHLGNDKVLSIVHEARMRWLFGMGYSELEIGGCGLIMADAAIVYKHQGHFADPLRVQIFVGEISKVSFELIYKLFLPHGEKETIIAIVKTGMVTFDYQGNKVCGIPTGFLNQLC